MARLIPKLNSVPFIEAGSVLELSFDNDRIEIFEKIDASVDGKSTRGNVIEIESFDVTESPALLIDVSAMAAADVTTSEKGFLYLKNTGASVCSFGSNAGSFAPFIRIHPGQVALIPLSFKGAPLSADGYLACETGGTTTVQAILVATNGKYDATNNDFS